MIYKRLTRAHHLSLSRIRSIQSTIPFVFLKIRFNFIFPSTPKPSSLYLYLGSSCQRPTCTPPLCHTFYMSRPLNSSLFDNWYVIWWRVQIIKPFITTLFQLTVTSSQLSSNIFLNILFPNNLSQCPPLIVRDRVSPPQ